MSNNLPVWLKLLLVVAIPLVFEVVFVLSLSSLLTYQEDQYDRYEQSKQAVIAFHQAEAAIYTSLTQVVETLTRDQTVGKRATDLLDNTIAVVERSRDEIRTTPVRPELKEAIAPVPEMLDKAIQVAQALKPMLNDPTIEPRKRPKYLRRDMLPLLLEFEPVAKHLFEAEAQMKAVAPGELQTIRCFVIGLLMLGVAVSAGISAIFAYLFARGIVNRLHLVEENAQLLAMRAPLKDAVAGKDEIGKLDQAIKEANLVLAETRRKELAILDAAVDVICSLDKRFRFTAVGAAAMPMWGFQPDDLLGESLIGLQTESSQQPLRSALEQLMQSGSDTEVESQLISHNSVVKDVLWKVSWSRPDQTFYCVAHDISERRAAERMKQRFISIASHDLKTPLSSISATLSVLTAGGRGPLPDNAQQVLHKADNSLERLMDLIRDLLDLEKLEAGKVVMTVSCVSALDACNAACDSVEFLAKSLGVQIARACGDSSVMADERGLVRVLINLVSNAIKFSPRGSTVTVSLKNLGLATEFSVSDQGPGIPAEDQEIIFEKFRQSRIKSDTPVKGTGLGLAIAKLIAEAHQGSIGVESVSGKGSRFFMQIPNLPDEPEEEAADNPQIAKGNATQ